MYDRKYVKELKLCAYKVQSSADKLFYFEFVLNFSDVFVPVDELKETFSA